MNKITSVSELVEFYLKNKAENEDEQLQEQINQFKVQISLSEEKIKRSQNNANNAGKRIDEPLTDEKLELISVDEKVSEDVPEESQEKKN